MRALLVGPVLAAFTLAGCVARTGPPVLMPGATALPGTAAPDARVDRPEERAPERNAAPAPDAPETVPAPAASRPADPDLARVLDGLLAANGVGPAVWGVAVRALDRNERLYARNADVLLTPASTMKIVTLAAAAERLGWDHRFQTDLLATGPIRDGVLHGDLVVRGAGDPTINAPGAGDTFLGWADELRRLGVRRIAGRIVGDDDVLDDGALETPGFGSGWAWDDLSRGFAAPAGALQHRRNVVDVVVEPGPAAGRPAKVRFRHAGSGLVLRNEVETAPAGQTAGIRLQRPPGGPELVVAGRIPTGSDAVVRRTAVGNPTLFFVEAFRAALERHGIAVDGEAIDIDRLAEHDPVRAHRDARPLVRHRSAPLSAIGVELLKHSSNLYAESLMRHLGAATGGSAQAGRNVVRDVLSAWGVDGRGAVVADGSGLSRYTYLTAEALVHVLAQVYRDPDHRPRIFAALPVGGRDGTLRRRLVGTAGEGVVHAKTGSMSRVRALAGYVETTAGEPLAFAILANNFGAPAAEVNRVIDETAAALAAWSMAN